MSEPTVGRRALLAGFGTLGTAGCLQLQDADDEEGDDGADEPADASDGSTSDSPFYSTREDALEYAASFAEADAYGFGEERPTPEGIRHNRHSAGSSSTGGPEDSVWTSEDLYVAAIDDSGVAFGGGIGRKLRVRSLDTGSTASFDPATDAQVEAVEGIEIDTRGGGELRDRAPEVRPVGADDDVELDGTWTFDGEPFRERALARYVVELLEDGAVVATTEGRTTAASYQWGFDQTPDAGFLTRHPAVDEDWDLEFGLGGHDPIDTVEPVHRPEDDVFEIDLGALDADSGEYDWRLVVRSADEDRTDRVVQFRGGTIGPAVYLE